MTINEIKTNNREVKAMNKRNETKLNPFKQYIVKYKDEFGLFHTSEYKTQSELEFWKSIRKAQGYKLIKL